MKYIRTNDGKIVNRLSDFNCFKSHGTTGRYIVRSLEDDNDLELWLKYNRTSVINQADAIEELIMPGDLVEIGGYVMEVAHAFDSEYKTIGIARPKECDDTRIYSYDIDSIRRLYIPNGNDYKLVAIHHNRRFDDLETIKEKGEWELL